MRIYLDNCCFNRPYDDQSQIRISLETQAKLHIRSMIRHGETELASSYMLWYENSQNPHTSRKKTISEFLSDYVSVFIDYDREVEVKELARTIMGTGVKKKDAVHVASAILADCDYFLTTDDRLLKYKTDKIILVTPTDFIQRLEADWNEQ